jgi:hypothetical protein
MWNHNNNSKIGLSGFAGCNFTVRNSSLALPLYVLRFALLAAGILKFFFRNSCTYLNSCVYINIRLVIADKTLHASTFLPFSKFVFSIRWRLSLLYYPLLETALWIHWEMTINPDTTFAFILASKPNGVYF